MSKITINKLDILVILNMLAYIIRYFTNIDLILGLAIISICGAITCVYCLLQHSKVRGIIGVLLIVDAISAVNMIKNTNTSVYMVAFIFSLQMMGILFYLNKDNFKITSVCALIIFFYLCIGAFRDYFEGVEVQITPLVGRNTVSILMIFSLGLYLIYCCNLKKTIYMSYFILALVVALLCTGSGGILSFTVFVAGLMMCNTKKIKLSPIKFITIIILGTIFVGINFETLLQILADDNSRIWLWSHYKELGLASFDNFWYGADVSVNWVLEKYANMHNTYLNFHYMYGLIPFIVYNSSIIIIGIHYARKKQFVMLILWGVMLIRAFTDAAEFAFVPIWMYMMCSVVFEGHQKVKYKEIRNGKNSYIK